MKFGLAYLATWIAEQMMGRRVFTPVFLGGAVEGVQDVVRTYIAPAFPALAASEFPLESYYQPPEALPAPGQVGAYYGSGGDFEVAV